MSFADAPSEIVATLQGWPPEVLWVLSLVIFFGGVVGFYRFGGTTGLCVWAALAVVGANVQVLKVVQTTVFPDPLALGTVLFCSVYLATDILSECHGAAAARRAVWIAFAAMTAWTVITVLTLGYRPLHADEAGEGYHWALATHDAMETLFLPGPALLVAGMSAWLVSQLLDIHLFQWLRRRSAGRRLWLRNNVSTIIAALVDSAVFSVLAWVVLAESPLPLGAVIKTYILGSWLLRCVVALLDTPYLYLACRGHLARGHLANREAPRPPGAGSSAGSGAGG